MDNHPIGQPGSASQPGTGLDQAGRRRIVTVVSTTILFVVILFIAAGRVDWLWGWVHLLLTLTVMLGNSFYILRTNPQAINERGRKPSEQKGWDKIIMAFYTPIVLIFPILIGLDVRFEFSKMQVWLHVLGAVGFVLGNQLVYWAMANNKFLSMYVAV